ncbi:MAG TPA: hypothetical protein PKC99_18105 [Anaerolineales bacterium]|nr:hypothetical protein [Anaerolineae bacterium]MBL1173004.1 hypothetical protein [Chloroflexota bacterium]MDL1927339.1 hypothetical protein [Anaerolineae bacterium AMX1]WKZ55963.1 MAG: hypothetical protein QY324_07985 [Anaerolineales bacterium]NOG76501.1 hypothetical protein [Chloroflexota bacterium]
MSAERDSADAQAHLFTLRIWAVNEGATAPKWRSRLQDVRSGEVVFCENLPDLLSHIEEALREPMQGDASDSLPQKGM